MQAYDYSGILIPILAVLGIAVVVILGIPLLVVLAGGGRFRIWPVLFVALAVGASALGGMVAWWWFVFVWLNSDAGYGGGAWWDLCLLGTFGIPILSMWLSIVLVRRVGRRPVVPPRGA